MTLNEIPKFFGGLPPQTPLRGLIVPPKPPAVCKKPLRGFVFPHYARPHQFLGGSPAPGILCKCYGKARCVRHVCLEYCSSIMKQKKDCLFLPS